MDTTNAIDITETNEVDRRNKNNTLVKPRFNEILQWLKNPTGSARIAG